MAHVRTQIRHEIIAALAAGGTFAGSTVADSRITPWPAGTTYALNVKNGDEQSEATTLGAPVNMLERAFALEVECFVSDADAAEAAESLDTLMAQVETVIAANCHAGGAQLIYPTGASFADDSTGDSVRLLGTVAFQCRYTTSQANPQVIR